MQDPYNPDLKPDLQELPWIIRKLVQLAYALTPKQDKQWIKDMQFELNFVDKEQKLRWVLGALGLAFKLRFSSLEWVGTPRGMALATALAAAIAAIVFVPQTFLNPSQTHQPAVSIPTDDTENLLGDVLSEPAAASDSVTARAAEDVAAAAPEQEVGQAASVEEAAEQAASGFQAQPELDVSVDTDAVDNVITETEVETAPSDTLSDTPTEAASAAPPLPSALALPTAPPVATEARERDEAVSSAEARSTDASLSDAADEAQTFVPTLSILVKEEGSLQIYQSDSASAEALVLDREVLAGEQFSFNLPVYIVSNNAGGLELTLNGELLGALGEKGERLKRVFEP